MDYAGLIKKELFKNEFTKNVITLMTGATIAQFLPILSAPLLTRLYSPENFGIFALYSSICLILTVLVCAGYEFSIMLPESDEDSVNIIFLCLYISIIISIFFQILFFALNSPITALIKNPAISNWLYLVPFAIFLMGVNQAQIYWASRKKQFKRISNNRIINSVIMTIVSIILGIIGFKSSGLILGVFVGQIFATFYMCWQIWTEDKELIKTVSKTKILKLAKKYVDFPKFSIWSTWINTVSIHLPIIMLTSVFNSTIVGFYSISNRFVNIPASLIGTSSSQVFIQKASENRNNPERLKDITYKVYKRLLMVGIIPFSIMMVYGDIIFSFVFGQEWLIAGRYAQFLSLFFMFSFVSSSISTIPVVLYKQKTGLILSTILILSRFLPLLLVPLFIKDAFITIAIFAIVSAIFRCWYSLYILKMTKVPFKDSLGFTVSTIALGSTIIWISRIILEYFVHIKG